jgi:hypothetical protein
MSAHLLVSTGTGPHLQGIGDGMANVKIAPLAWSATGKPPLAGDPYVHQELGQKVVQALQPESTSAHGLDFQRSTASTSSTTTNEMSILASSSMSPRWSTASTSFTMMNEIPAALQQT